MSKAAKPLFAVALAAISAERAQACSVCVVADDGARAAYYATTALMSFLPLMLIGGVILYIVKRRR